MFGNRALVACALAPLFALAGCNDLVPLGSWGRAGNGAGGSVGGETGGDGGGSGEDGGSGDGGAAAAGGGAGVGGTGVGGTGGAASLPLCGTAGEPGDLNPGGDAIGVTIPYTDWTWPSTFTSLEWELRVESELTRDGYFWAHQFDFSAGPVGFMGLQGRGGYQPDPPAGPVEISDMVVFWISSSPLDAELGDIDYPDARTDVEVDSRSEWRTIHARYDWDPCTSYHLRVARDPVPDAAGVWYGAFIRADDDDQETFLGRILVPAAWGSLRSSSMWSNRVGYSLLGSCRDIEPASALFGIPTADGGTLSPIARVNRFEAPQRCATSRFTVFPGGVRQELGLTP
jgi:hypothetical protein